MVFKQGLMEEKNCVIQLYPESSTVPSIRDLDKTLLAPSYTANDFIPHFMSERTWLCVPFGSHGEIKRPEHCVIVFKIDYQRPVLTAWFLVLHHGPGVET